MHVLLELFRKLFLIILSLGMILLACVFVVSFSLNQTILNADYVKEELQEEQVYDEIADAVRASVKEAYLNSSYRFPPLDNKIDELLTVVIKSSVLQKEFEDILDQVYAGQAPVIHADYFIEDYSDSIYAFLTENKIPIKRENVEELLREIAGSVLENVDLTPYAEDVKEAYSLTYLTITSVHAIAGVGAIVLLLFLFLLGKEKRKVISFPLLFSGLLLAGVAIYVKQTWITNGPEILNAPLTLFFQSILGRILFIILTFAVLFLAVGSTLLFTHVFKKRR